MSQQDSSIELPSDFQTEQLHAPLPPGKTPAAPLREGLPPTYRMRADAHYVDLLSARSPATEQQLAVADIEVSDKSPLDEEALAPLVDSVRRYGILQPLLVQSRGGRLRLIAGRRRLAAAVAVGLREVPCLVHDVNNDKARALAEAVNIGAAEPAPGQPQRMADVSASAPASALLEQSLATLMACSTALGSVSSTWTRGGVTELVRAEAWRASCLSVSTRLLRGELEVAAASTSIARVIDSVVDAFTAEARVRGIDLDVDAIPRSLQIAVDAQVLSAAVANAIFLTIGVLDGLSGSQIKVAASADDGSLAIVVSQQHAGVPSIWPTRVFDEAWTSRPGGEMSYVAAVTMKTAVERHGGTCALAGSARSTRITIALPMGI